MAKRIVLAAIILNKNNEVLLQKKDLGHPYTPGRWCFFGGELKEGKNPQEALKEILKRKTGVEFNDFEFLVEYPYKIESSNGLIEGIDLIYVCRFNGEVSDINLTEGAGFAFLDKSELGSHPLTKHSLEILKEYFK